MKPIDFSKPRKNKERSFDRWYYLNISKPRSATFKGDV